MNLKTHPVPSVRPVRSLNQAVTNGEFGSLSASISAHPRETISPYTQMRQFFPGGDVLCSPGISKRSERRNV